MINKSAESEIAYITENLCEKHKDIVISSTLISKETRGKLGYKCSQSVSFTLKFLGGGIHKTVETASYNLSNSWEDYSNINKELERIIVNDLEGEYYDRM